MTIGTTFIKDATVIGFIVNETISLIENAGRSEEHTSELQSQR